MRFCKECNNMLYPCENKDEKKLMFACTNCDYKEKMEENNVKINLVYRNEVKLGQSHYEIDPCIINDPTYSRTKNQKCPECGYSEAIFFQNPNVDPDVGMKLIFVCCRKDQDKYCGKYWSK
jgi:DNA-directed RNA polymerase II subunit RPB9